MSNTLPKHEWNLNCLSYGSNLLIKLDNVDILQAQFEKFESHFRNNEHVIYDVKLPLFIIETFSKLWKLWTDFSELHDVIKRNAFFEVFKNMSSYFQIGNDPQKEIVKTVVPLNVSEVEKSRRPAVPHYLLVDEFQRCGPYPPVTGKPFAVTHANTSNEKSGPSSIVSAVQVQPLDHDLEISPQVKLQLGRSSDCSSSIEDKKKNIPPDSTSSVPKKCSNDIPTTKAHPPAVSVRGKSTVVFFKEPSERDLHCGPCCRSLSKCETVKNHLESVKHKKNVQLMTDCLFHLRRNEGVIVLQSVRTMLFLCRACHKVQEGTNCLVQHCKSKHHLSIVEEASQFAGYPQSLARVM